MHIHMHMHELGTCQPLTAKHVIAADLHTLQGLQPVVQLLLQDSTSVQAAAAFVLGTAASNNNKFQEQLMEVYPESVMHLLRVRYLLHCYSTSYIVCLCMIVT